MCTINIFFKFKVKINLSKLLNDKIIQYISDNVSKLQVYCYYLLILLLSEQYRFIA